MSQQPEISFIGRLRGKNLFAFTFARDSKVYFHTNELQGEKNNLTLADCLSIFLGFSSMMKTLESEMMITHYATGRIQRHIRGPE